LYEIVFSKGVEKDIGALDSETRERVFAVLGRAKINPFRQAKKLEGSDFFRFRVGDYRIVAGIGNSRITVYAVEHRKNVYK
jgi:mRNA-degrading endonuclease RelE of RelBE toxin-antitoxin system